jgi:hypothetical protein
MDKLKRKKKKKKKKPALTVPATTQSRQSDG